MIALLITATSLMTSTPSQTSCNLIQGNTCCNDCESREILCESKGDSLSEALDCLNYSKKCVEKCIRKEADSSTQSKSPVPTTNK